MCVYSISNNAFIFTLSIWHNNSREYTCVWTELVCEMSGKPWKALWDLNRIGICGFAHITAQPSNYSLDNVK